MRLVDAHHHLWDPRAVSYELLRPGGPLEALASPFPASAFDRVAVAHGVTEGIAVEATSAGAVPLEERAWLLGQVAGSSITRRVVAWAPVERADLGAFIDDLSASASEGGASIVAIRRSFEAVTPGFIRSASVVAGVRLVADRGLAFDLVLFGDRLEAVVELVHRVPEASFVLDHLAKPSLGRRALDEWQRHIAALAGHPNVSAKVSGLATMAPKADWEPRVEPLIRHAADQFGWQRLMFGSDWPICELAGGFGRWLAFLTDVLASASSHEREAFFAGTADRVYSVRGAG